MTVDKWERRQLCDDGACTGVIGSDGTCKVCGRPAPDWGDLRKPGRVRSNAEIEVDEAEDEPEAEAEAPASPAKVAAAANKVSAWNERRLCSDGACVGLIGDDGTCKVCGKPGEGVVAKTTTDDDDEDDGEDEDDDEADEADEELAEGDDGEDEEDGEEDEDDEDEDDDDEVAQDDDDDDEDDDDEDDEEANRTLCSDGACVGVIGDDGKCKVCGKAAA